MLVYPPAISSPTRQVPKGIIGHSKYLVGQRKILIIYSDNSIINCDFLVSVSDPSSLGLNTLKQLHVYVVIDAGASLYFFPVDQ